MNVAQILDALKADGRFRQNLTAWHTVAACPPRYAGFPDNLNPRLVEALKARGISDLYTHQREAIESVLNGENICVVTPTASGKTLCYNLPVLNRLMGDPQARALYLFPTKALSQDQVTELMAVIDQTGLEIGTFTFDGDTPSEIRRKIRKAGHIVVTNPDMLHAGILPHHTKWINLFEKLTFSHLRFRISPLLIPLFKAIIRIGFRWPLAVSIKAFISSGVRILSLEFGSLNFFTLFKGLDSSRPHSTALLNMVFKKAISLLQVAGETSVFLLALYLSTISGPIS